MEHARGYEGGSEYQNQQELERIKGEALLELVDYEIDDQLIDLTTDGEHHRCVAYIKNKYEEFYATKTIEPTWPERVIDGNDAATVAVMAANYYRIEKEFQDFLINEAVTTRQNVEDIERKFENEEEVDPQVKGAIAYNKVVFQAMFDVYYGKKLSSPWQQYFNAITQPVPSIDYRDPNCVAVRMMVAQQSWQFMQKFATHNRILLDAAHAAGLFKIDPEDKDMVLRMATIIVEIQDIARTYHTESDDNSALRERLIREYGHKWKVGEKLIDRLIDFFSERYQLEE